MTPPTALPPDRFALTRPLVDWLAEDACWSQLPWRVRIFFRVQAVLGSLNARLAGLSGPPATPRRPAPSARLLIVGPWRSGTTALHELLAASGDWITPRTWQCMAAPTLGLLRQRSSISRVRPMDDRSITGDSPQEDEFGILSLGGKSAYRGFLMPHRLEELQTTLRQESWQAEDDWFTTWERFLDAISNTAGRPTDLPLLLKSPNHTFRLKAMLARQPEARFVWVVREPTDVLASNLKMWRTMAARYALTPIDEAILQAFLVEMLRESARTLQSCIETVSTRRLAVVSQADLRRNPVSIVAALAAWLADDPRFVLAPDRVQISRAAKTRDEVVGSVAPAGYAEAIDLLRRVQDAASVIFNPTRV